MEVCSAIHTIKRLLVDEDLSDTNRLLSIEYSLPTDDEYCFYSMKDLLLNQAKESGKSSFKLLATMNSRISIFQWCDDEQNFVGMCPDNIYDESKYKNVSYTLEQLPDVIDNAEKYLKSLKENPHFSGSPYFISSLHIMSL